MLYLCFFKAKTKYLEASLFSDVVTFPFYQPLKVTILNGPNGLNVTSSVGVEYIAVQERAPIPHRKTVETIAKGWDQLMTRRLVTQTPAVSRSS